MHAEYGFVSTPDGQFCVVTDSMTHKILASGWTENVSELVGLIHRDLRPLSMREADVSLSIQNVISAYYDGRFTGIVTVPLLYKATDFRMSVWSALRRIPSGSPVSYATLARMSGHEGAVRAAASACANNPVALFVPCHRVIRSDGSYGGFRYGLAVKSSLLTREVAHNK